MFEPTDLTDDDQATINHLRHRFEDLREEITARCEPSRETSLALTNLEQSAMWAFASIGLHGAS